MRSVVFVVIVLAIVLGIPMLLTRGPVAYWLSQRSAKGEPRRMQDPVHALLRREVGRLGAEYERLPYQRLTGDLRICIDANPKIAGRTSWKTWPSYQFYKRRDGTTYY